MAKKHKKYKYTQKMIDMADDTVEGPDSKYDFKFGFATACSILLKKYPEIEDTVKEYIESEEKE